MSLAKGHPLLHAVAVDSKKKPAPKRRTASAWAETGGQSSRHGIISCMAAGKISTIPELRGGLNMGKPWGKEVKRIDSWWIFRPAPGVSLESPRAQKDDLGLLGFFRTWK